MYRRALLGAALLGLVAAAPAAAAGPTLGARLSPTPIVYEQQPYLEVTNLSTVAVTVSLEFTAGAPDGWQLATESFPLAVGELRRVAVTAARDAQAVTITATLRPQAAAGGIESSVLALVTTARHASVLELYGPQLGLALTLAVALLILLLIGLYRWQQHRHRLRVRLAALRS